MALEKKNDKINAYRQAEYRLGFPSTGGPKIHPDAINPLLDGLLEEYRSQFWFFLTPCNPGSRIVSREENQRRLRDFYFFLDTLAFLNLPAYSTGPDWPVEQGAVIFGMEEDQARRTGRLYGQSGLLMGSRNEPAHLLILDR